jgi:hypothetical protein
MNGKDSVNGVWSLFCTAAHTQAKWSRAGGTTALLIQLPVFSHVLLVVQDSVTTQTGRRDPMIALLQTAVSRKSTKGTKGLGKGSMRAAMNNAVSIRDGK